jgi:hypothetical protein
MISHKNIALEPSAVRRRTMRRLDIEKRTAMAFLLARLLGGSRERCGITGSFGRRALLTGGASGR